MAQWIRMYRLAAMLCQWAVAVQNVVRCAKVESESADVQLMCVRRVEDVVVGVTGR